MIRTRHKYGVGPKHLRTVAGIVFDSIGEAERWKELTLLQTAGKIEGLQCQVSFDIVVVATGLLPPDGAYRHEKVCTYVADFTYRENGRTVVEDCKGVRTPVYKLKKKLLEITQGIVIRETTPPRRPRVPRRRDRRRG